jgi:hypothetical protein
MIPSGLLTFARQVHFIEDRATVLERAVDVIQSASGAAWVAAYGYAEDAAFVRVAASGDVPFGSPDTIDPDDPTLVALRAERVALDGLLDSLLAGALVLPFATSRGITGLIALGPGAASYDGELREALHTVATATGLALETLEIRALREQLANWRERAEWAERELALLHRILDRDAAHQLS